MTQDSKIISMIQKKVNMNKKRVIMWTPNLYLKSTI